MHDALIVGGGFFGLYIAEHLAHAGHDVLLVEQDPQPMLSASFNNQARIHRGYHYPRSVLTALRSCENFSRFVSEFPEAVDRSFTKIYMIGQQLGKVTARQFEQFCLRIGAPMEPAPRRIMDLVNPRLIEAGWIAEEYAFNADALRETMMARVADANVEVRLNIRVLRVESDSSGLLVTLQGEGVEEVTRAHHVFNCTYSSINDLHRSSSLPLVPLKHEMAEMCLVDVPEPLQGVGITVMCGPFFSVMPFPARGKHSFSHVRYTPHYEWFDTKDFTDDDYRKHRDKTLQPSRWRHMRLDARRYMPILDDCQYCESLFEVKTVLPRSEVDDSRPILMRFNCGVPGLHCVLGGKIDNVYDAIEAIAKEGIYG